MHWKITALWGGKKVELRETQRAVTPFGGLVVFFEFLRQVGYREAVSKHLPFHLTSPNAIDPVETFTAFLLSVVAGARRFAHTSLLRAEVALQALLGISRFPGDVGDTPGVRLSERAPHSPVRWRFDDFLLELRRRVDVADRVRVFRATDREC